MGLCLEPPHPQIGSLGCCAHYGSEGTGDGKSGDSVRTNQHFVTGHPGPVGSDVRGLAPWK